MNVSIKHFIITRFNLRSDVWRKAKDGSKLLTDDWMANRWKLFESFCLPSVINQSDQDFFWAVCFDTSTSERYRKKIKALDRSVVQFNPIFMDGIDHMLSSFKQFIQEQIRDQDDYIITTRLDNDDAIHRDFVKTVKSLAEPTNRSIIDLRTGHQMIVNNGLNEVRKGSEKHNAFVSLVEPVSSIETVVSKMHRDWKNEPNQVTYSDKPMWIQMVHDRNILNAPNLMYPVTNKIENDFGIHIHIKQHGPISLVGSLLISKLIWLTAMAKQNLKKLFGRS